MYMSTPVTGKLNEITLKQAIVIIIQIGEWNLPIAKKCKERNSTQQENILPWFLLVKSKASEMFTYLKNNIHKMC